MKKHVVALFVFLLLLLLLFFFAFPRSRPRIWHYQLQGATFEQVYSLDVPFVVVDPDDAGFSAEQLYALRERGTIVLAYLSIGEAEDYRDYWVGWRPGSPDFVVEENPEWPGNYVVRFWDPRWERIVLERAEEILRAGYHGLYLDRADVYEFWVERGVEDARERMVDLICRISDVARRYGALVFVQNAQELYADERVRACVDGFGREDTWYVGDAPQEGAETREALEYLDRVVRDGKIVLAIDYPRGEKKICDFYRRCWAHGFYCTVSNRELSLPRPVLCGSGVPGS